MNEMLASFAAQLQAPFVHRALIAGVLIAFCSSLLGVTLVLKRFSFIGDGLSHVAFGATAIASAVNLTNDLPLVLVITIACAILLLRTGQNAKIKGDASIAMISVGALALGYLLVNILARGGRSRGNVSGDVCTTLFGSTGLITLKWSYVVIFAVLTVLVFAAFVYCYTRIFSVTFDENFAKATGMKTEAYNLIVAIIIAVVIVLAMKLVGSLLVSALVVFPALSAMRVFRSFKAVTVCSAVISVCFTLVGMLASMLFGTPPGATIVAVDILGFAVFTVIGKVTGGVSR